MSLRRSGHRDEVAVIVVAVSGNDRARLCRRNKAVQLVVVEGNRVSVRVDLLREVSGRIVQSLFEGPAGVDDLVKLLVAVMSVCNPSSRFLRFVSLCLPFLEVS
jgi:hypothetical protein